MELIRFIGVGTVFASMTFEEIYQQIEPIEGWMGESDCIALYEGVKNVYGLIVEIGAYMGRSTKLLALSSPQSTIITIDSYKENPFFSYPCEEIKEKFYKTVKGLPVTLINEDSHVVGKTWDRPIDFLFIDGSHLYDDVLLDIKLFIPHVKKGSYVYFHDYYTKDETVKYQPNRHGVYKAVQELKDEYFDEIKVDSEHHGFAICRRK